MTSTMARICQEVLDDFRAANDILERTFPRRLGVSDQYDQSAKEHMLLVIFQEICQRRREVTKTKEPEDDQPF